MDWGFKDPFVALVGALDPHGTLHLVYERYKTRTILARHSMILKKLGFDNVMFFGDPSGAQQIADMNAQGIPVIKANNDILAGIEATTARIITKTIKIYRKCCPSTVKEFKMYRYASEEESGVRARLASEKPIDKDNHGMDALRYLIRGLDNETIADAPSDEEREQELAMQEELARETAKKPSKQQMIDRRYADVAAQPTKVVKSSDAITDEDTYFDDEDWCSEENSAVWQNLN